MAVSLLEFVSRMFHVEGEDVVVLCLVLPVLNKQLEGYALRFLDPNWGD